MNKAVGHSISILASAALVLAAAGTSSGQTATKRSAKDVCMWTSRAHVAKHCYKAGSKLKIAFVPGDTHEYIPLPAE